MISSNDNSLLKRLLSSFILIIIALTLNFTGGIILLIFVLILSYILLYEFYSITNIGIKTLPFYLTVSLFFFTITISFSNFYILSFIPVLVTLIFMGIFFKLTVWSYVAIFYLLIPLSILIALRMHLDLGVYMIFWCFIIVWSADSLSYLIGKSVGGPLLWKKVSPNKTWSGFWGGIIGATFIGYFSSSIMPINIVYPILISFLCGMMVAFGDLFESWIKRKFNKKDSSNLIPGHGGFLDRLDGFLFALIFVWLITIIGWV